MQIVVIAGLVVAIALVVVLVYRIAFGHRLRVPGGGRTRQPRLGLVDAFSLDGQRQLVLVRRDNVEHLIMIGGPNDVLVESQIVRAAAAQSVREGGPGKPRVVAAPPTMPVEAL
ncbi:MAG: flagellar biosynthetic protein FliO, partial [Hyphomicrobiales bacterium]|nr:flagellar biosynthetic protein FliO [Hyphomicrobiales bacterium]